MICPDIYPLAEVAEHLPVGARLSGNEDYDVVLHCKGGQVCMSGRNLTADCIVGAKMFHPPAEPLAKLFIFRRALCSLAEDFYRLVKGDNSLIYKIFERLEVFNDKCLTLCLSEESKHLCMTWLAKNQYLSSSGRPGLEISLTDAFLKFKHHGAGAVYYL